MIFRADFFTILAFILPFLGGCATPQVEKNQEKAYLHLQMGISHLASNRLSDAITSLQKAKQLDPELNEVDNHLGLAFFLQKRYNLAEKSFKLSLTKQPDLAEANNNLCALYLEINLPDKAIEQCNIALNNPAYTNPATAEANLAKAYLLKKSYTQVLAHTKNALSINPNHCLALKLEGEALFLQHHMAPARTKLENAIRRCPQWAEPHFLIAKSFTQEGSKHLAKEKLQEVIQIFDDPEVKQKAQQMLGELDTLGR